MADAGSVIEDVSTDVVLVPLTRPVGTSIHQIESVGCVLVTVRTADGVTGEGFCFTIDGDRIRAFDEMVMGLARFAIGRSVFESGRIWADVWSAINPTGHKGVTVAGYSAIDTAVWDAAGRTVGLPLHRMWGAVTDRGRRLRVGRLLAQRLDRDARRRSATLHRAGLPSGEDPGRARPRDRPRAHPHRAGRTRRRHRRLHRRQPGLRAEGGHPSGDSPSPTQV